MLDLITNSNQILIPKSKQQQKVYTMKDVWYSTDNSTILSGRVTKEFDDGSVLIDAEIRTKNYYDTPRECVFAVEARLDSAIKRAKDELKFVKRQQKVLMKNIIILQATKLNNRKLV